MEVHSEPCKADINNNVPQPLSFEVPWLFLSNSWPFGPFFAGFFKDAPFKKTDL